MERENIDGDEFLLLSGDEYITLAAYWEANGGEIDDVGDGVVLFTVQDSVQFRARVERAN